MRKLLLIAALMAASIASAANVTHTSTLRNVYQLADGRFVLQFDTDSASCTNASSPKFYYVSLGFNGMTAEGAKNAYAMALTAFAMEKRIMISFDDASSGCYVSSVLLLKN